jgi:Tle cognate immunity protein 4 C-terminal domain/Tle cognate immunity protein 4 N-terminal domain
VKLQSLRWLLAAAAAAVVLAVVACDQHPRNSAVTDAAALPPMRTHCVGRFLIDLPEDFEQTPGSDMELVYGLDTNFRKVKIQVVRPFNTEPSFEAVVNKRASELASQEHFKAESKSMLVVKRRLSDKSVLIRSFTSPDLLNAFKAELFSEVGSALAVFSDDVFKRDVPEEIETKILRVAEQTRVISKSSETGRGTCFGPLLVDAKQDGEIFIVGFLSKQRPDMDIDIYINSLTAASDGGMLKRWDGRAGLLKDLGFKMDTLRRGKVAINGQPGEELLSAGKEKGHVIRVFSAESVRTEPATFAKPDFSISLNMGGERDGVHRDASLSESDALKTWDAIVKSIRLRPGAL